MTPTDKLAAAGVAAACGAGSVDWETQLRGFNVWLHTGTLLVGIIAGIASVIYYWTNRKISRGRTGATGPRGPQGEPGSDAA